ncbi:hypothetical protein SeLEV6574_g01253 [Synchytrium endobioticum]|nr:hypothetical protein SeLEV6574_g01253 [Synchytrium endobioticum]
MGTTLINNRLIISRTGRVRSNATTDTPLLRAIQNVAAHHAPTWTTSVAKFLFLPGRFRALLAHHASLHARANDLLVALKKNAPIDDAVLEAYEHLSADVAALSSEETIVNPSWGLDLIEEEKARKWIIGEVSHVVKSLETQSQQVVAVGWAERIGSWKYSSGLPAWSSARI